MDNEDGPMIFPKVAFRTKRWEAQKKLANDERIPHTAWIRRACDAWETGSTIARIERLEESELPES